MIPRPAPNVNTCAKWRISPPSSPASAGSRAPARRSARSPCGTPSRWAIPVRILGAWTDVDLAEPIHHLQRAAFRDPSRAADHHARVQARSLVGLRLERCRHPRVALHARDPLRVEEGAEDELVAVETGPGELDVTLTVRARGDEVGERPVASRSRTACEVIAIATMLRLDDCVLLGFR